MADYRDVFLTDNSRFEAGKHCPTRRYYEYHAGPYGYGYKRKALNVPLTTGTYTHEGITAILREVQKTDQIPGAEFMQLAGSLAVERYKKEAKAIVQVMTPETEYRIEEQSKLIAGQVFGWARIALPALHEDFKILRVEQESDLPLESTFKVVRMAREDFTAESRANGILSLHDLKTCYAVTDGFIQKWSDSVQMMMNCRSAERALGKPIKAFYIHALVKGSLKADYNQDSGEYDGPKRQQSLLCYGYHLPSSGSLTKARWEPKWKFQDEYGKNRTLLSLGKGWKKTLVPNPWQWVQSLEPADLGKLFQIIGPYEINEYKVQQALRTIAAEEDTWISRIRTLNQAEEAMGWANPGFQERVDVVAPRSYECWKFNSQCSMYKLCFKHEGWQDPVGSGLYVHRRPHHAQELSQMQELGFPVPAELGEEGEGEE